MSGRSTGALLSRGLVALVISALAVGPVASRHLARRRQARRIETLTGRPTIEATAWLTSPPAARPGPFLSSWETIGGCGAGGSGSGSSSIKWIGRNVHGGLLNVTQTLSYLRLRTDPQGAEFRSGYNLTSVTQIGGDLSEKLSGALVVPLLYKYYGDVLHNDAVPAYDLSNGGLGDISLLGMVKLGRINDTILTFNLGLPTGPHRGQNTRANAALTQEKQLGFGKVTGSLTVDHAFDQIWGLFVVGGSIGYRGGMNDLDSYRAPNASVYAHTGYYLGPFVPSMGLTLTGFLHHDRDQNSTQNTPLGTLAPSAAIEWSNDYVALLLGATVPFGTSFNGNYAVLPWTMTLGVSVSPF